MDDLKLIKQFFNHQFDLQNQDTTTTFDWEKAFLEAVCKRTSANHKTLSKWAVSFSLSSGSGCGGIHAALFQLGVPHQVYIIPAQEYTEIMYGCQCSKASYYQMSKEENIHTQQDLLLHTDEFSFSRHPNKVAQNNPGAVGTAGIAAKARQSGAQIFLSGVGADISLSDNGPGNQGHSYDADASECDIAGVFPADLTTVWPWKSVTVVNPSVLGIIGYVLGSYGLQERYPFLGKLLV